MSSSSDESEEASSEVETRVNRHRRRSRGSGTNRYVQLVDSSNSLSSSLLSQNRSILNRRDRASHSFSGIFPNNNGESVLSSSLPNQPFNLPSSQQVFYLSPNVQRTADQLTEEDQIKLLKRMTLIQQLPCGAYDQNKKHRE